MFLRENQRVYGGADLNHFAVLPDANPWISKGLDHVGEQAHLLADDGPLADAPLSSMRLALLRRALRKTISLFRPILGYDVCSTHSS